MANFVRGRLVIVAEAYDTPSLPVPGIWHGMPVTPALVTWRIQPWSGKVVVPRHVTVDFRATAPTAFWNVYERGTFQNMSVFGKHYSYLQPGCFLFKLTPTPLDTSKLRDGVYDLVVTVADVRGNTSSLAGGSPSTTGPAGSARERHAKRQPRAALPQGRSVSLRMPAAASRARFELV